jgi:hypothetical protein
MADEPTNHVLWEQRARKKCYRGSLALRCARKDTGLPRSLRSAALGQWAEQEEQESKKGGKDYGRHDRNLWNGMVARLSGF